MKSNLPRPAAGVGHRLVNRLIDVNGDAATLKARGPEGRFQYEIELRRTGESPDGGWQFSRLCIIFNKGVRNLQDHAHQDIRYSVIDLSLTPEFMKQALACTNG